MSTDDPDDPEGELPDYIAEFEAAESRALFDVLLESGVSLPPPDELDEPQLTAKLWEVINALALMGAFLHNTDHLSDRELYSELWSDVLREEATLLSDNADYAWHIDMIGSGSEEHIHLQMKYYASEKERQDWLEDWPDDVLPDHVDPPYAIVGCRSGRIGRTLR